MFLEERDRGGKEKNVGEKGDKQGGKKEKR